MLAQEPILQINFSLSNELIATPVHDSHPEDVVHWKSGRQIKPLAKDWTQTSREMVLLVIYGFRSSGHLEISTARSTAILRQEVSSLQGNEWQLAYLVGSTACTGV